MTQQNGKKQNRVPEWSFSFVQAGGQETEISLEPMTRERMHELYHAFTLDPDTFEDMSLYEKNRDLKYNAQKVDALFEMREREENSMTFAVMLWDAVIGEVGLRHIDVAGKECELSIHLQNDSVKNRGYGTQAEKLAAAYAFEKLGMERVRAESILKNARSQHVLEKAGFIFVCEDGRFRYYVIDRDSWLKSRS